MFWSCFDRLPASLSARNTHRHTPSHATYRMLPMYMMHSEGATWNLRDRYRALFMSSCRICIGFLWGGGRCRNSCVKLRKKLKDSQTAFARLIVSPFLFVAFGAHCWSLCRKLWRALCNNLLQLTCNISFHWPYMRVDCHKTWKIWLSPSLLVAYTSLWTIWCDFMHVLECLVQVPLS